MPRKKEVMNEVGGNLAEILFIMLLALIVGTVLIAFLSRAGV